MEREPSLHVTRSALIKLIDEVFSEWAIFSHHPGRRLEILGECADKMLEKGKIQSCSSRSIITTNEKLFKKSEKIKLASRSDAGKFAQALLLMRRKCRHRGVTLITPGDKDWLTIKELSKDATEFSNEFGFELKKGYLKYVELGLGMMSNHFALNKLKSLHSAICNKYEALQEIEQDKYPNKTKEAHDTFIGILNSKTGYAPGYEKLPEKYRYFVKVANEAKEIGVSIRDYIKAQFAAFDWKSAVPEPSQLVGEKAKERLSKYMFENDIAIKNSSQESTPKINFNAIKGKGKNNNK